MRGPRLTAQEISNIIAWKKEGYTGAQIGRRLGRSKLTASSVSAKIKDGVYQNGATTIYFSDIPPEPFRKPRSRTQVRTAPPQMEFEAILPPQPASEDKNLIKTILESNLTADMKLKVLERFLWEGR